MEAKEKTTAGTIKAIVAFLICLLISFGMWIYVMSVESPEYTQLFTDLTVQLEDEGAFAESGLAVYSGYGTVIDLTLAGKKSIVSKLTSDDIPVYADLSGVTVSGRYSCDVLVDIPAGCKLVEKSQDSISVYVDSAGQKTVQLSEKRENLALPEGCAAGTPELDIDNVTVSGPRMVLSKIEKAVVTFDMTDVMTDNLIKGKVELTDMNGAVVSNPYLSYSPKEIEVEVPIYKTVRVPVEVEFKNGFLNSDNTLIRVEPSFVDVTGEIGIIEKENLIKPVVIDERQSFETGHFLRVVALEAADGVELSDEKVEVSVSVVNTYGNRSILVPGENIEVEGVNENVEYTIPDMDFDVTLLGRRSAISHITSDDITLVLDLSPYTSSNSGVIRVKADVKISDQYAEDLIATGTYYVNVDFGN